MSQKEYCIVLTFFLLGFIVYIAFLLCAFLKERRAFIASCKSMGQFEKYSLQLGIVLFFFMPLLESHPAKDSYVPKVLYDMMSELGRALFILGVIALLQRLHEHSNKQ